MAGSAGDGRALRLGYTPTLGGPLTTASGLTFIGSTMDSTFRAFDTETGRELWHAPMPASAVATPMTYRAHVGGRQYVVVAAGGHASVPHTSWEITLWHLHCPRDADPSQHIFFEGSPTQVLRAREIIRFRRLIGQIEASQIGHDADPPHATRRSAFAQSDKTLCMLRIHALYSPVQAIHASRCIRN